MAQDEKRKLVELGKKLVERIKKGKPPVIDVPVRSLSNVNYNEKKKILELGNSSAERNFFNVGHVKKFVQTLEVAKISKQLIDLDKHASLRDVFYMAKRTIPGTKINIVDEQTESDKALEDLANRNGTVAGNVVIVDKGDTIDWSKLGSGGWSIPSNVEDIKFKKVNAKYVIYMEKAAVWDRLHEDKYWDKHNCIIMSSQGQTTRGIRRLLRRLADEHKLPVYVLADFDPWGFYIYSVLKHGSINLAHISDTQTVPNAKFLGIIADDIEKYKLDKHFIKFKDVDKSRLKQIADYDWFKNNKAWQRQFKLMSKYGAKAEIQALSARGLTFITDTYLPEKIKKKDWIE
jgi:DNA topoisomerase-6 subunit A